MSGPHTEEPPARRTRSAEVRVRFFEEEVRALDAAIGRNHWGSRSDAVRMLALRALDDEEDER